MNNYQPTPSMALAAYLERFIEGRRVIVFGDSTSGLASHLLDRGARLVHVYDDDISRVAEATARSDSQDVTYAPLGQSGVAVRDGAFDLGVIENLSLSDNPKELVRRLRRALSARGIAAIATPNPDSTRPLIQITSAEEPSYYELYDRVSAEFDEIKMLGQTPFVGYAVADFGPESDESVSLDTAFLPGGAEEPDFYVALASHFPVDNDPFSVIQFPLDELRRSLDHFSPMQSDAASPELEEKITQLETACSKAQAQTEAAEASLGELQAKYSALLADSKAQTNALQEELKTKLNALQAEVKAKTNALKDAQQAKDSALNSEQEAKHKAVLSELAELKEELSKRDSWLDQLEGRAAAADARADEAEAKLEALRLRHKTAPASNPARSEGKSETRSEEQRLQQLLEQREAQLRELEDELEQTRQSLEDAEHRKAKVEKKLEKHDEKLEKVEHKLKNAKKKAAAASESEEELRADLDALEAQLKERAGEVQRLERDLARTAQWATGVVEELRALKEGQEEPPILGELNGKLESLAEVDARRVADLAAAQWTIQQLEARLAES